MVNSRRTIRDPFSSATIRLRPFRSDDMTGLQSILNDPSLVARRYIPWMIPQRSPLSIRQVESAVEDWEKRKKGFALAVEGRPSGCLAGYCECNWDWDPHCPSLSVVIAPMDQLRGLGSAVMELLLSYLFEQTPAHNVNGWIDDWNSEGLAFAEAMGFRRTGTVPRVGMKDGRYVDGVLVDILRSEWREGGAGHGA